MFEFLDVFEDAYSKNSVIIVEGETGSGKTTQIPQVYSVSSLSSVGTASPPAERQSGPYSPHRLHTAAACCRNERRTACRRGNGCRVRSGGRLFRPIRGEDERQDDAEVRHRRHAPA